MTLPSDRPDRVKRRLAVILASDVAGYSRLVGADEEDTVRRLGVITARFRELVTGHDGRVFNTAGDAVLAEFTSAVDAVRCALDVQDATRTANGDQPADRRIAFRIGIAIGDVIVTAGDDLLGDGVNIAARLETLAEPGGICVSDEVRAHVQAKIDPGFTDLGLRALKNIAKPVHAFSLGPTAVTGAAPAAVERRGRLWPVAVGAGLLALAFGGWILLTPRVGQGPKRPVVADQIPFVSDRTRAMLRDRYFGAAGHKALALARDGFGLAVGAPTADQAMLQAMEKCEAQSKAGCDAFAADDEVVWPRPLPVLPAPEDMRATGVFALELDRLPLVGKDDVARAAQGFVGARDPKALAVGAKGLLGWAFEAGSVAEATRRALERCADRNGSPCLLYAVGDKATEPLPRSHAVTGYLDLTAASAAAGPASWATYRGPDWRALARDGEGRLYAAGNRPTEDDAAAAALAQCRMAADACRIYAIGSFLVASE